MSICWLPTSAARFPPLGRYLGVDSVIVLEVEGPVGCAEPTAAETSLEVEEPVGCAGATAAETGLGVKGPVGCDAPLWSVLK